MAGHAYRFAADAQKAVLAALRLEGRKIRRIELVFDVDEPVTVTIYEYAVHEQLEDLCHVLALGDWHEDSNNN